MNNFDIKTLTEEQKQNRKEILTIAYEANHSHIGSCLSSVDLIDAVYKIKKNDEKFILSNGHAGMGLYAVLKKYGKITDEEIKGFYIHPDRDIETDIYVSTGSLGQGLPIALGMAIANKEKNVYCLISDGECAEGSIWEALRICVDKKVNNLKILLDANGWSGYDSVDTLTLKTRLEGFGLNVINVDGHDINAISQALNTKSEKPLLIFAQTTVDQFPFLIGQDAHYYVMAEDDYNLAMEMLK